MKKFLIMMMCVVGLTGCAEQIDAGNRGVKTVWGETQQKVLEEGLYFYTPISTKIYEMDCKTWKIVYEMESYTKDVQQANLRLSVMYNVKPEEATLLFKEIGLNYANVVIYPTVVAVAKDTVGQWEADKLVSNREQASNTMLAKLQEALKDKHIRVTGLSFESVDFSKQFESAIEAKQIAQQDAIKAKNRSVQIEEESKQKLMMAKAEAEAMAIQAKALAQNKSLVAYEAVKKWNGVLPVNIYGSAPIPFIEGK